MTSQPRFGGTHTEKKLNAIEEYLVAFLRILSNTRLTTVYIDAFAGAGVIPSDYGGDLLKGIEDVDTLRVGSAIRALKLERRFNKYIFIEKSPEKLAELRERIRREVPDASNIEFINGDAAVELTKLSVLLKKPNVRSVVFLDPFGSQVDWFTLVSLARTQHVDLWYLFPSGLSVYRQISSSGEFTVYQKNSIDRLFGPNDWQGRLLKREQVIDLFGPRDIVQKVANIDDITRYMIECMNTIFAGEVSKKWLPLGRGDAHWYSLIFAMANSSLSARKVGHRVARHLMTNS
jgi:three-Cys-motif partner protein